MQPSADWGWPTNWVQTAERVCEIHSSKDRQGEADVSCDSQFVWFWHMMPQAWQVQLWGEVLDKVGFWICPNEWNRFRVAILGGAEPGDDISDDLVEAANRLWAQALHEKQERIAVRPASVDFATARCDRCGGGAMLYMGRYIHECPVEAPSGPAGDTEVLTRALAMGSTLAVADPGAADPASVPTDPLGIATVRVRRGGATAAPPAE